MTGTQLNAMVQKKKTTYVLGNEFGCVAVCLQMDQNNDLQIHVNLKLFF